MLLPFVREVFADVETLPAFRRVASHLREGTGRIRLSGLTPAAKAIFVALLQKTCRRPVLVIVPDNKTADDLYPVLRAMVELTGVLDPESVVEVPNRDVLPFQNHSAHPEIQEARAAALWRIATGGASIVIAPLASAAMRLQAPSYYGELARVLRRGDTVDTESLLQHLSSVGYTVADIVEMPGEYALRGGILDVYPPEAERPLRIELFGDEIESIRKFDPATQRSATSVDEVNLLPLTETPLTEQLLAAINARLSGKRISGQEDVVEQAIRADGLTVFPGWENYAAVAGAKYTLLDMLPRAVVVLDEPSALQSEHVKWWDKLVAVHEQSLIGNLVRPEDLFLSLIHI